MVCIINVQRDKINQIFEFANILSKVFFADLKFSNFFAVVATVVVDSV